MKYLWTTLGIACLICGVIGIFLPLLPTTPFLLLTAFAFSKGSPRFHKMLLENRLFGPAIRNWEEKRTISRKVKRIASIWIALGIAVVWWRPIVLAARLAATTIMAGALVFIWKQRS